MRLHIVYSCPKKRLHNYPVPHSLTQLSSLQILMESPTTTVIRSLSDLVEDDVASAVLPEDVVLVCCLECFECSDFLPVSVARFFFEDDFLYLVHKQISTHYLRNTTCEVILILFIIQY